MKQHKKKIALLMSAAVLSALLSIMPPAQAAPADFPEISVEINDNEWAVLSIVNSERLAAGLEPLSMIAPMQDAVHIRSSEIGSTFSHTRPNGSSFYSVFTDLGMKYAFVGENIAYGQRTPEDVMKVWMNSSGHRANILQKNAFHIGIGYDNSGNYKPAWAELFLNQKCSAGDISIVGDADIRTFPKGTKVRDMELILELDCTVHGSSYLSVIDEMTSGYNPDSESSQSMTVNYGSLAIDLEINRDGEAILPFPEPTAEPTEPAVSPVPSKNPETAPEITASPLPEETPYPTQPSAPHPTEAPQPTAAPTLRPSPVPCPTAIPQPTWNPSPPDCSTDTGGWVNSISFWGMNAARMLSNFFKACLS